MTRCLKNILGRLLISFARIYFQKFPGKIGKKTLWKYVYWREKHYIVNTTAGTIKGNTRDMIQKYLYYFGTWEPNLTYYTIKKFEHHKNRTFIDIGANIGYFSLLVAKLQKVKVVS